MTALSWPRSLRNMGTMRRSLVRTALACALVVACAALAGCAGRPSASYYAAYQRDLLAKGRMRVDYVAADAPFDADDLARDFRLVVLNREADSTRPGGDDNLRPSPLKRWSGPLRYRLAGSAVTATDRAEVANLMARISRLTGIDTAKARQEANFVILITTPQERDAVAARLRKVSPRFAANFNFWRRHPALICIADNLYARDNPNLISAAIAVIGSETTGLLRRACLNEEIAQALGPANDNSKVRPSVFNDDGEFALLTRHDELILKMLYDKRLVPGMTAKEAMPIVRRIARELVPDARAPAIAAAMSSTVQ